MQFDEKVLTELGIMGLSEERQELFIATLQEELEIRVGERISEGLTKRQMEEFDELVDDAETKRLLEENAPDYKAIIEICYKEIRAEVSRYSSWIMKGVNPAC